MATDQPVAYTDFDNTVTEKLMSLMVVMIACLLSSESLAKPGGVTNIYKSLQRLTKKRKWRHPIGIQQ